MKTCVVCHKVNDRPRAETCSECRAVQWKKYCENYRNTHREECWHRSRKSVLKKPEYYRNQRREYYREKHGIPLGDPFRKRKAGEGNIDCNGYKTITVRGHPNQMDSKGRIREHVFIMSQHLGRPLFKGETVHHKNGDRLDNRIENLELWNRSQPGGQRIEDRISWCIELLTQYGYVVTKG